MANGDLWYPDGAATEVAVRREASGRSVASRAEGLRKARGEKEKRKRVRKRGREREREREREGESERDRASVCTKMLSIRWGGTSRVVACRAVVYTYSHLLY